MCPVLVVKKLPVVKHKGNQNPCYRAMEHAAQGIAKGKRVKRFNLRLLRIHGIQPLISRPIVNREELVHDVLVFFFRVKIVLAEASFVRVYKTVGNEPGGRSLLVEGLQWILQGKKNKTGT